MDTVGFQQFKHASGTSKEIYIPSGMSTEIQELLEEMNIDFDIAIALAIQYFKRQTDRRFEFEWSATTYTQSVTACHQPPDTMICISMCGRQLHLQFSFAFPIAIDVPVLTETNHQM